MRRLFETKASKLFALLTFLLFMTMLTFQLINERFWLHDLEVMYAAATALLENGQIYGTSVGLDTGFYKYSPFTLFFFVPYALLPYKVACILHFLITLACAMLTFPLLERIIRRYLFDNKKKYYLTLFIVLIAILIHLVRDLHLGNINMILVFLLTLSIQYLIENKYVKFGIIIAFIIITKPYFIVFVLPLLLHKKYKEILSIGAVGALSVVLSLILIGFSKGIDLYFDWFAAMLDHSSYLKSNNTIFYILNRYTGISIGTEFSFLLLGIIAVITSLYFWRIIRINNKNEVLSHEERTNRKNIALIIHLFVLIAFIPNVFITDTEHFLFSLPLISILIQYFSIPKRFVWIPLIAFMIFLYGGNSTDMMGDYLNENYKIMGLLGIGNLMIITTALIVYHKNRNSWGSGKVQLD